MGNRKIENFIRTKYDTKRWIMDGPMPDPSTLDEGDDDVVSVKQPCGLALSRFANLSASCCRSGEGKD